MVIASFEKAQHAHFIRHYRQAGCTEWNPLLWSGGGLHPARCCFLAVSTQGWAGTLPSDDLPHTASERAKLGRLGGI